MTNDDRKEVRRMINEAFDAFFVSSNVRVSGNKIELQNESTSKWHQLRCRDNQDGIAEPFIDAVGTD